MDRDKTRSTIFDDDFEVTYEEETSVFSDDDSIHAPPLIRQIRRYL